MANEIQAAEQTSPASLIKLAIEGNADLEKLEKLLALQKDWESNEARKAYASEFAVVQSNIEAVIKTKMNPQTHSNYAPLENVLEIAKPAYTKQGFSVIYYESESTLPEHIRLCADVLHKAGHKETYHMDIPLDGVGIKGNANMTKIHGKASSISYGRRYLQCMIWNISTQDDDGNSANENKKLVITKPTKEEQEVLDAIYKILSKSVPDNMELDKNRIQGILYAVSNKFTSDITKANPAVTWLLSKHKIEELCKKITDKVSMEKSMEIVEQAFFDFETEHQEYLADKDGKTEFNLDEFIKAIYKNFGSLPTSKESIAKIVNKIEPIEVAVTVKE